MTKVFILALVVFSTSAVAGSGTDAGYDWASRKNITNASDCTGNSRSFINGCLKYVDERKTQSNESIAAGAIVTYGAYRIIRK
jgi:hypothetical protein